MAILAVTCGDLHLSHLPPAARSKEEDWYGVMARSVRQLKQFAQEHKAPILCAGDLFDRWNSPPELINFALSELPEMYAVAGQHDLPYHRWDEIHRSAFWTLVKANKIHFLGPHSQSITHYGVNKPSIRVVGFSWGQKIVRCAGDTDELKVVVAHQYVWRGNDKYEGAPRESMLSKLKDVLQGYDVAVFGDNHKGFKTKVGGCKVINSGGFIRRNINQEDYEPFIGYITDEGVVGRRFLDLDDDCEFVGGRVQQKETEEIDVDDLIEALEDEGDGLDYAEALNRYMNDNRVDEGVKGELLRAMEPKEKTSGH